MEKSKAPERQLVPSEEALRRGAAFLAAWDRGQRPAGRQLSPKAVVTFIVGSGDDHLRLGGGAELAGVARSLRIVPKYIGERSLVERCVVTLAGDRGLLLVGEPGTAKSMLSELLTAAIAGPRP